MIGSGDTLPEPTVEFARTGAWHVKLGGRLVWTETNRHRADGVARLLSGRGSSGGELVRAALLVSTLPALQLVTDNPAGPLAVYNDLVRMARASLALHQPQA